MTTYLTETGDAFKGYVIAEIVNGRSTYSKQTVEELRAERPDSELTLVSGEELAEMLEAYYATLATDREEITEARYWDLLECLPPCRFTQADGCEVFHISERLTGNLVTWCAHVTAEDKYYEFTDDAALPIEGVMRKAKGE